MLGVNSKIKDEEGNQGTIVERYTGSKPAMKGMFKVQWDAGGWSWEEPENLSETLDNQS